MKLNQPEVALLKLLINHETLTLQQITYFLNVSSLTSRKYLNNLKKFLESTSLGKINKVNNTFTLNLVKNIDLDILEVTLRNVKILNFSSEERINYLLCLLIFETEVSVSSLVEIFNVSRNTLALDIKKIKKLITQYNLSIISKPWKGIELTGNKLEIEIFSIQFILKFLIEKEFSLISWYFYGKFTNPLVKTYLDKKFSLCELDKIKSLTHLVTKKFDLFITPYMFVGLESFFIYQNIKKQDSNLDDIILERIKESNLEELFFNIKEIIVNIPDIHENPIYNKSLNHLTLAIFSFTKESIFLRKKNKMVEFLEKRMFEIYDFSLEEEERFILINLISTFRFKFNFSIQSNCNYYITPSEIPKSIITEIKQSSKIMKFNILEEDFYILALFIYQLVRKKFTKLEKEIKILLYDSTYNDWCGTGFAFELKKYLPFIKIDIISIYGYQQKKLNINYDDYNYILFTNFTAREIFIKNNSKLKKKLIPILYKDFFNINEFWGQLFFDLKNTKDLWK
ncbi:helix-turn-helix domain-containing protein [Cetobacterium somerae]|uniref:helix-turn-helix domain-containing protein n=2 Tax=Cetobacterium somerae TaxID=188913 RepID=UPI0038920793